MPKDLLKAFLFTAALPSPPLPIARLNVARDPLRTRLISAVEVTPDVRPITRAVPPPPPEEPPVVAEVAPPPPPVTPVIAPDPVVSDTPPAPIVPGIIVLTARDKSKSSSSSTTASAGTIKKSSTPAAPVVAYVAPIPPISLSGAGAAASAPLYQRWSAEFQNASKSYRVQVNYQSVTSGVMHELRGGRIDFAASDMPMTDTQIRDSRNPPLHFPAAVTAVVAVYNVPGISETLKLTPESSPEFTWAKSATGTTLASWPPIPAPACLPPVSFS